MVEPTHLKKKLVKLGHVPLYSGWTWKNVWNCNHHLENCLNYPPPFLGSTCWFFGGVHSNIAPARKQLPKAARIVFQQSIFRCYGNFRERISGRQAGFFQMSWNMFYCLNKLLSNATCKHQLGGGFNQIWKIWVKMGSSSPGRGEHRKCLSCHHLAKKLTNLIWYWQPGPNGPTWSTPVAPRSWCPAGTGCNWVGYNPYRSRWNKSLT